MVFSLRSACEADGCGFERLPAMSCLGLPGMTVILIKAGIRAGQGVCDREKKMKKIGRFHVLTDTCLQTSSPT